MENIAWILLLAIILVVAIYHYNNFEGFESSPDVMFKDTSMLMTEVRVSREHAFRWITQDYNNVYSEITLDKFVCICSCSFRYGSAEQRFVFLGTQRNQPNMLLTETRTYKDNKLHITVEDKYKADLPNPTAAVYCVMPYMSYLLIARDDGIWALKWNGSMFNCKRIKAYSPQDQSNVTVGLMISHQPSNVSDRSVRTSLYSSFVINYASLYPHKGFVTIEQNAFSLPLRYKDVNGLSITVYNECCRYINTPSKIPTDAYQLRRTAYGPAIIDTNLVVKDNNVNNVNNVKDNNNVKGNYTRTPNETIAPNNVKLYDHNMDRDRITHETINPIMERKRITDNILQNSKKNLEQAKTKLVQYCVTHTDFTPLYQSTITIDKLKAYFQTNNKKDFYFAVTPSTSMQMFIDDVEKLVSNDQFTIHHSLIPVEATVKIILQQQCNATPITLDFSPAQSTLPISLLVC
jgi:hypothetical protein